MKITKTQLKEIIKEELDVALNENAERKAFKAFDREIRDEFPQIPVIMRWGQEHDEPDGHDTLRNLARSFFKKFQKGQLRDAVDYYVGDISTDMGGSQEADALYAIIKAIPRLPGYGKYQGGLGAKFGRVFGRQGSADKVIIDFVAALQGEYGRISGKETEASDAQTRRRSKRFASEEAELAMRFYKQLGGDKLKRQITQQRETQEPERVAKYWCGKAREYVDKNAYESRNKAGIANELLKLLGIPQGDITEFCPDI